jgi:hypothetical protein
MDSRGFRILLWMWQQVGASGPGSLRYLLSHNSACADILGGTDNALAILTAANQVKTNAQGFSPPTSFLSPEGEYAAGLVIQNVKGAIAGTDFAANDAGQWTGTPFNVYANTQFMALTPSQRQTVFIHELHHVAVGHGDPSAAIDGSLDPFAPSGPFADIKSISQACHTGMINPPQKP